MSAIEGTGVTTTPPSTIVHLSAWMWCCFLRCRLLQAPVCVAVTDAHMIGHVLWARVELQNRHELMQIDPARLICVELIEHLICIQVLEVVPQQRQPLPEFISCDESIAVHIPLLEDVGDPRTFGMDCVRHLRLWCHGLSILSVIQVLQDAQLGTTMPTDHSAELGVHQEALAFHIHVVEEGHGVLGLQAQVDHSVDELRPGQLAIHIVVPLIEDVE
mmetsp:Transcript_48098/g.121235  ORF Transcript_48098/g.121235 Transcript_48098/m.121235 type:complete len:217 (-) Transcript_48098:79-729(-)